MTRAKDFPNLEPDYRHVRFIESGGFADVYEYEQAGVGRVAVKAMRGDGLKKKDLEAIVAEATLMGDLREHQNVVPVFAARMSSDGRPCIIMMYCSGDNLYKILQRGTLNVHKVVHLGVDIANAIEAAHRRKIIHRDIKPANILTDQYHKPRLTDFGIARVLTGNRRAQDGMTLAYSPPEILEGADGSIASDIYSLGATLYHLLAGRAPFSVAPGKGAQERLTDAILNAALPRINDPNIHTVERRVPEAVESYILGMLNRDANARPRSAKDVAAMLSGIEKKEWGGPPGDDVPWHVGGIVTTTTRGSAQTPQDHGTIVRPGNLPPALHPAVGGRSDDGSNATILRPAGTVVAKIATKSIGTSVAGSEPQPRPVPGDEDETRRSRWLPIVVGLLVVVGVVAGVAYAARDNGADPVTMPSVIGAKAPPRDAAMPGRPTVTGERLNDKNVRFTWIYSSAFDTDSFRWKTDDGRDGVVEAGAEDLVVLPQPRGTRLCLRVKVVRIDGSYGDMEFSNAGCVS